MPEDSKNIIWENNSQRIIKAIMDHLTENGMMPSRQDLTERTGLSRQTIYKHLKEFSFHEVFAEHERKLRFMEQHVLAKVLHLAAKGDIGAAKLYFNVIGRLNGKSESDKIINVVASGSARNTLIQNQNNYIHINGIVLSQESVQQLSPEKLNMIEAILKSDQSALV